MVHLQEFYNRYAKDGLLVFAISMFPYPEMARKATKKMGITYSVLDGYGSELGKQYAFG
jgi:hypothetical protein